jgi:VCBS repeat protein
VIRFACISAVIALTLGVALAVGAAPPRVSFAIGLAPTVPDGFEGFGDAETMAAADLNGDGRLDLALGSAQDRAVWLALGTAAGGLATQRAEFPVGGVPSAIAAGDLNGDGHPDLVVARTVDQTVGVLLNDGHGGFAPRVDYETAASPIAIALADLNGDGRLDVATADADRKAVSVRLNRGAGVLRRRDDYGTAIGPVAVAAGDLNRDGNADLVTANRSGSVSVLLGRGDGTFAAKVDYAAAGAPSSIALADFDRDGILDAAVGSSRTRGKHVTLLLGRGDGSFRARRSFAARVYANRLVSGDLNGDGSPDLVFSDGGALAAMLNRGDGTFQGPLWYGPADTFAVGDFSGDGRLDLAGAWVDKPDGRWALSLHRSRPGYCNVQDVTRRTLAVATDLLSRASCSLGRVRRVRSRGVRRGRVVSQSPRFPAVLPGGAKVALVISRGG